MEIILKDNDYRSNHYHNKTAAPNSVVNYQTQDRSYSHEVDITKLWHLWFHTQLLELSLFLLSTWHPLI